MTSGQVQRPRSRAWLEIGGGAVSIALWLASLILIGWLVEVTRFATARLPAVSAAGLLSLGTLFVDGLRSVLLMLGVFAAACVLAWLSSARRWEVHGPDWHDIIRSGVGATAADQQGRAEHQRRERLYQERRAERAARALGVVERWGPVATVPAAIRANALRKAQRAPQAHPGRGPKRRSETGRSD